MKDYSSIPTDKLLHMIKCSEGVLRSSKSGKKILYKNKIHIENYKKELEKRGINNIETQDEVTKKETPIEHQVAKKYIDLYSSAMRRNKKFNLTLSDVRKLVQRKTCAYTNVKFSDDPSSLNYKTIDRLDSDLGYVKGNVFAVTRAANQAKNILFECNESNARMSLKCLKNMCTNLEKLGFDG